MGQGLCVYVCVSNLEQFNLKENSLTPSAPG